MFGLGGSGEDCFDEEGEYVPSNIPEPGPFLEEHTLLTDDAHVEMHDHARESFEEFGVYDATFGYNLARLNLDRRHPDAGLRYARDRDDERVLRVEFTPTTPFCPQSESLTRGTFRALTRTRERSDYDVVRVRVHPMHHAADGINDSLERGEEQFAETGSLEAVPRSVSSNGERSTAGERSSGIERPF